MAINYLSRQNTFHEVMKKLWMRFNFLKNLAAVKRVPFNKQRNRMV